MAFQANPVLPRNCYILCYISLFTEIILQHLMHSKLKSKVPLWNCEHLKRLGVTSQRVVKSPIMSLGAEDMENFISWWLRQRIASFLCN